MLYLGEIQGYSPLQIGQTLIWVGLPQFLIFPCSAHADEKIRPATARLLGLRHLRRQLFHEHEYEL
ncbi:MAG: hypothetical protein ABJB70_06365 [Candidatus Udaeobacter sp.]